MFFLICKWIHLLGAIVLFGTGVGIAFFFFRSNQEANTEVMKFVNRQVVLADKIFTLPAVILTPLTGFLMVRDGGYSLTSGWLMVSLILFVFAGTCWVFAAVYQGRMLQTTSIESKSGEKLPDQYWKYHRMWILLGGLAFPAVLAITFLMVLKPF